MWTVCALPRVYPPKHKSRLNLDFYLLAHLPPIERDLCFTDRSFDLHDDEHRTLMGSERDKWEIQVTQVVSEGMDTTAGPDTGDMDTDTGATGASLYRNDEMPQAEA